IDASRNAAEAQLSRDAAEEGRLEAISARKLAESQRDVARQNIYFARMSIARQAWDAGNVAHCLNTLDLLKPQTGESDLRGFEFYHLWRMCHQNSETLVGHEGPVIGSALSDDGSRLVSAGADGRLLIWDISNRRQARLIGDTGNLA